MLAVRIQQQNRGQRARRQLLDESAQRLEGRAKRDTLGDHLEKLFLPRQQCLSALALISLLRFAQCPPYRRHDSPRSPFQEIIGRPDLERLGRHLFARRSRDEYEGHLWTFFLGDLQGREAVEGGTRVLGEDDVEAALLEKGDEV